jgi:hypothetical protein
MAMANEFCPHCAQEIDGDARFCPHCGQQIIRPGMAPPAPAATTDGPAQEMPLLAFSVQLKKGMLSSQPYIFIGTPQRLILAAFDNKKYQTFIQQQKMAAKERGDGFLKKIGNAMMSGFAFVDQYRTMPPQAILAENKANFFIPWTEVEWLRYQKKESESYDGDSNISSTTTTIKLTVRAGGNEFKMGVSSMGNREQEYLQHFHQLLGERFRNR